MQTRRILTIVALAIVALLGLRFLVFRGAPPPAAVAPTPLPSGAAAGDAAPGVAGSSEPPAVTTDARGPLAVRGEEPPRAASHRLVGRVLDATRRPVAGARVAIELEGALDQVVLTDAAGAFEGTLELAEPWPIVSLSASDGRGNGARRALPARSLEGQADGDGLRVEVEALVLSPSHTLRVRVREDGGPAAGARLRVELGHGRSQRIEARADERGEATLEFLPRGPLYLEARADRGGARAKAFVPEDASLEIALEPFAVGEVLALDALTRAPVAGARVALDLWSNSPAAFPGEEDVRRGGGEGISSRPVEVAETDGEGRARFADLIPGGRYRLSARAEGYQSFPRPGSSTALVLGAEPMTIELAPLARKSARWPIAAGEVPIPADGTPIELRVAPEALGFGAPPPEPLAARMQGAFLVADRLGEGNLWMARDPAGSLARLWIDPGKEEGKEATFRRPRRVEVRVRERDGRAVERAGVVARSQGNNLMAPVVRTDAEGLAVIEELYGGLVGIHVDRAGGDWGRNVAQVDLEKGDAAVEVVLPGSARASVTVLVEGRPLLPPTFRVSAGDGVRARVLAEDPEAAVLELELEGLDPGSKATLHLRAPGVRGSGTTLEFPADGSPARGEIALVRTGVLHVRVAGETPEELEVAPERFDEPSGSWKAPQPFAHSNGLRYPNGPAGGFAFGELEPGRWRVLDRASGTASDEAELAPGGAAEVLLVLSGTAWVSGRVELDDPAELVRALVRVEGLEADASPSRWLPGQQPPEGIWPKDGEFRIRVPKDREVTLVPWHPWLVPAADGTARVRGRAEGLVLRLVEGDGLILAAPQLAEQRRVVALRVARFPAGVGAPLPAEPLEWHHAPLLEGRARCAIPPGTWTLWIDPGAVFEPLLLRDVEVAGQVERTVEFRTGSALRVRVLVPEGQDPPRLYVSARSEGGPDHYRDLNSRGEAEVVLAGLAAGRYAVSYGQIMNLRTRHSEVLEFDGLSDQTLELDLR